MSRANPLVLEALDTLKAKGFVPTVKNGGMHFKITWVDHGRKFLLVVSSSPSTPYAERRSRTLLRRLLNSGH
jgi:hypothetical protein